MAKRVFDVFFASMGLLILSPLMLLIFIYIKLDSRGPAIFGQQRIGRWGRPFKLHKFRTMVTDVRGLRITTIDNKRITRIGRVLRKTNIDELPQLVNVVMGDMSLVGPRPEVEEYVALYPAEKRKKILSIRPGITDNAAIEFRNEGEILAQASDPEQCYVEEILPAKLEMYEAYVDHHTLLGDFSLIVKTIFKVAFGSNKRVCDR